MEFSGKTTEEAVAKALDQLGLERDDISVEIVERGKSGFLGIGAVDAVIRVEYEAKDEPVKAAPRAEAPKPAPQAAPAQAPAPKAEAPQTAPVQEDKPQAARPTGNQAQATEAFISGLLEHMGVQADIEITAHEGGGLDVNLSGSGIGAVIGRRGETLDAIQHLTNYAVNRGSDKHSHINVDAENYRAKREESLIHLAEKMAGKAIKYKRSMALEPMNSYERHVIHAALQDFEGVTTSSTGAEPNRRVVVSYVPTTGKKQESGDYKEWC
jgi:spoIIIJ-associated protein